MSARFENRHDIGVTKRSRGPGLPAKTLAQLGIVESFAKQFYGNQTTEIRIASNKYASHAAFPDRLKDLELSDGLRKWGAHIDELE